LFRRFLMSIIVVILKDHLFAQVFCKAMSVIAAVIIIGAVPFNKVGKKNAEFLNEAIIMCVLYTMICFSPFVPDINAKQIMGYFCCIIVAGHLTFNLYLIIGA
jgi:hypothetical protein